PVKFLHTVCTTFIESELVSYRADSTPVEDMVAGVLNTVARRVGNMGGMVGSKDVVAMTGGVARNPHIARLLSEHIGHEVLVPQLPQIMGALGAALIAAETAARRAG
ncbi:MAG: 2-hydroxyglutaryl-CoA dehydratase, partial [Coriobacteriales bacterium]|nr:2-hydroxyglutaryl-CoA dehydratase [Coriobacteriales bacterium]